MSGITPWMAASASRRKYAAQTIAKAIWQNRGKIYKGARQSYRAAKRRKTRRRSRSRGPASRIQGAVTRGKNNQAWVFGTDNSMATIARKTLAAAPIVFCTAPDTNDNIRAANALTFRVKGFKYCAIFRNRGTSPLNIHFAIVQPKEENITVTGVQENMFTNSQSTAFRYQNFATGGVWDARQDCATLNANKFNILMHKRFKLNDNDANNGDDKRQHGATWCKMEKYVTLNKTFQFEAAASTQVMRPMWILVWYEGLFADIPVDYNLLELNINTHSFIVGR